MSSVSQSATSQRARGKKGGLGDLANSILNVPERIERPRLMFVGLVLALVLFGLLMIYSASSIKALNEYGTAGYYVVRQLLFVGIGFAFAGIVVAVGYERLTGRMVYVLWGVTVLLLLATFIVGKNAGGATRWIQLPGGLRFQPSEFAKPAVVLITAALLEELTDGPNLNDPVVKRNFWIKAGLGIILPLGLILIQPDKGSTMILAITLAVMLYLSGMFRGKTVVTACVLGGVGFLLWSMRDSYSRARILTMLNPWSDPYGDGYQLTQGFLAFGLGGIKGVGIGMSTQKYAYLPEAHNDFIFAIVGEELGLIGTLAVVAAFLGLLWAGFGIARSAPNARGRLVAAGATTLLVAQFLVNVCGVLGLIPLSGKPIPFLSYGGTAALAFLIDVGLVMSVSLSSALPATAHEAQRAAMRISDDDEEPMWGVVPENGLSTPLGGSYGRSTTGQGGGTSPAPLGSVSDPRKFRLVSGGDSSRSAGPDGLRIEGADNARITRHGGRDRIELGRTSYDRLRSRR